MQAGILRCSNLMTRPKLKSAGGWSAVVTVGEADHDNQWPFEHCKGLQLYSSVTLSIMSSSQLSRFEFHNLWGSQWSEDCPGQIKREFKFDCECYMQKQNFGLKRNTAIHLGVLSPKRTGAPQNSWVLLFNLQPSGVEKIFPSSWLEIDHDASLIGNQV